MQRTAEQSNFDAPCDLTEREICRSSNVADIVQHLPEKPRGSFNLQVKTAAVYARTHMR